MTRATNAETANANNISSNNTEIAANITAIASLGTDKENTANKSTDGTLADNSDVDFPTEQAVKTYVDAQVGAVSQDDDITDATLNASSVLAIKEGSTEVTVDLSALEESDDITANTTAIANEVTRATAAEAANATAISNEVTRATNAETANANNISSNDTEIAANTTAIASLGTDKENTANKSTDGTLVDNSDVDFPTEQAVKTYVDAQVGAVSQDDDITDATLNASSVLAIKEGTTEVTVDLSALEESDDITANTTAIANEVTRATAAETANATAISNEVTRATTAETVNATAITALGTDKENTVNKSTDGTLADNSDVDFPTEQAVKTYVDAQVGAVSQDDDITDATLSASSILAIKEGTTEVTVDLSALEESDDITANTTAIANEVTRATAAETANATAITALGTDKENTANKSTDGTLADNSDVDFPTEQAVKTYVDAQVGAVSQDDDITDATLNASSILAIKEGTTEVTVDLSALEESADITANTTAISNEVTRATDAETANTNNISSNDTEIAANITAITALGTDKENTANKSTDGTLADNSDVDFPTEQAVKTYVDAQVGAVSQDDDITDATLNASSVLAIKEGTTEVTVDLSALEESDDITANTTAIANEVTRATNAETANANNISSNDTEIAANITAIASLGTDKENTANKSTDGTLIDNSDVDFPTEQAVKTYVDAQVGAVSQDDDITDATLNASSILAIKEGTTEVTVDLSALEESADITANTTAIANEVTRATAAETANTTAISNEVTRATNAETANTTAIANEVTRATDAETANATAISNEVTRATNAETANTTAIANEVTRATTAETTNATAITALGTDKENTANKSTDGTLVDNSDVDFPTEQAVKTYVDAQVGTVSQDDDITDATLNASSVLAIKEGTTEVTVDLSALEESDDITANTTAIANEVTRATDAETVNATAISNEVTRATDAETTNATAIASLGTDKENTANKSTDGTLADNSDVDFPTEQAVKTYVDAQVGAVSQDDDITDATLNSSSILAIKEGTTEVTVDLSALEESDDITANTTAIANEVTRATAAETANTSAIANEVTRATDAETANANNISSNDMEIAANITAITALGTDKENTANKSIDGTLADNSDVDFPTEQAVKTYVDAQVGAVSQDDDITDATLNASSILAIQEGTTEVTVDLSALEESADITANTTAISNEVTRATDAETANANNISSNDTEIAANITAITALGTDKENTANKSTDGTLADNSDVDFPTEQAVKTYVDAQVGAVSQDDDITDATLNASSVLAIKEGTTEVTVDLSALEESDDITANTTAIANEVTRATAAETANTTAISNEVTRATNAETANANNISSNDTEIAANITAIASLGTDKENTANKSTDGTLADNSDVDFPTEQAVKTYVDAQVGAVSQDDDITDATLNASSILAIKEGTTEVTVDLSALEESDDITANTTAIANEVTRATDAETENANNISSNDTEIAANITAIASLGTDKENTANKSTDGTLVDNSDVDFPTEQAVKTYVDAQVSGISGNGDISSIDLVVGGDTNALLGDVTLEIKANAVTTAKINPGSNNQTLITNGTGAVAWVDSSTLQHTGTEGSLFFAGSDGSPTENNGQVFFDASNNRFGIGTNTPDNKLQVTGAIRSQGFLNSDGNANEPAFRFSGDTNTGMYRRAADEIGFSVGGNDAIIIDEPSTGNTHVIITQSLELEGTLTDTSNSVGTAGQVLTSTATGTAWIDPALVNAGANSSPIKAIGKIAADGSILKATTGVIITKNLNTGHYTVTLPVGATTDANYIIQLSQPGRAGEGNDDPGISYSNQTTTSFDVIIGDNDNGGGERIRFDSEFMFTILDF
ncbi:hypothetical protein M601_010170 [Cellulophaga baltica 4]|nr:hypothetical protein M601_010170 [Cellulophaga baltica 4]